MTDDQLAVFARRVRSSFTAFLHEVWKATGLDRKSPLSWVELDYAEYVANEGRYAHQRNRRRIGMAFRGFGKSYITAALALYRLLRDPSRKVLIISRSLEFSSDTIRLMRRWADTIWFLKHLAPRRGVNIDRESGFEAGCLTLGDSPAPDRAPSVLGIGWDTTEGCRGHTLIVDDIEMKANVKTTTGREELRKVAAEFTNIVYPSTSTFIDPCEIVVLGTYKTPDSLYVHLSGVKNGYTIQSWPLLAPTDEQAALILGLSPTIRERLASGQLKPTAIMCPKRFTASDVAERRAAGEPDFNREQLLIASEVSQATYPIRLSNFITTDVPRLKGPPSVMWAARDHNRNAPIAPDIPCLGLAGDMILEPVQMDPPDLWSPYRDPAMFIDIAGLGSDETVGVAGATLGGLIFVHGLVAYTGGTSRDNGLRLIALAHRHRVHRIAYESNIDITGSWRNWFDALLAEYCQSIQHAPNQPDEPPQPWRPSLDPVRSKGQKELRIINTLEPLLASHSIVIDRSCFTPTPTTEIEYELQYQLAYMTRQPKCIKHNDRADALAGLVSLLKEHTSAPIHQTQQNTYAASFSDRLASLGLRRPTPKPNFIPARASTRRF